MKPLLAIVRHILADLCYLQSLPQVRWRKSLVLTKIGLSCRIGFQPQWDLQVRYELNTVVDVFFPQSSCTFLQPLQQSCSSREMSHLSRAASSHAGSSRRGQGSSCLPTSKTSSGVSSQGQGETEMLERILDKPKLVVVEEPKERGMRFRYECEGRSAGSILGASGSETNKTQPAVEVQTHGSYVTCWSIFSSAKGCCFLTT